MRILLDTCVWGGAGPELEAAGHEVDHVAQWLHDPGDREILSRAHRQASILVTLDKDFGELAVVGGQPHFGILRLVGIPARRQGSVCRDILDRHGEELARGAIVTVMPGKLRIRDPEGGS